MLRHSPLRHACYTAACAAAFALASAVPGHGQAPSPSAPAGSTIPRARVPPPKALRRVLVVGAALGWQHESIPDGMAMVWNLGHESGMWEAYLRTDYGLLTKKNAGTNAKNLDAFDALVFVNTTGEMPLDADQKRDLLSFVHDDGKGFVGVHAALDANYQWPDTAR